MSRLRKVIHTGLSGVESVVDRRRPPAGGRVVIQPYLGIGRGRELLLRGRVLIEKAITRALEAESLWRNVVNSYRRFQSDELSGARVVGRHRDAVVETKTDDEGYFRLILESDLVTEALWHPIVLEAPDHKAVANGEVLVPPADAEFAIISDVDDTIVHTAATSVLSMVRSVLMQNAATRPPLEGVAAFYEALHRDRNPIFYVSSSPWNLHDLIVDYMAVQKIIRGPIFLQDFGISDEILVHLPHRNHKLREITLLLEYYPDLPFVLIGDSGQHDPEIYLEVVRNMTKRIKAVFIRDASPATRDQSVHKVVDEARALDVPMIFVQTAAEAMVHARSLGLIH